MLRYRSVKLLIVLVAAGVGLFHGASSSEEMRILPKQVTLSNVEAFKEQMRRDLPPGTEKVDVEEYLTRWNILHSFYGPSPLYGANGNAFQGRIPNIGRLYLFPANLFIRIHLDSSERVREIFFRVDHVAP